MFNGQLVLLCFGCFLFFDRSFVLQFSIRYRSFFQFIFVSVSKLFILTLSHLIWMMTIANCLCSSRPFCSFRSNNYTSAFYFSLFFCVPTNCEPFYSYLLLFIRSNMQFIACNSKNNQYWRFRFVWVQIARMIGFNYTILLAIPFYLYGILYVWIFFVSFVILLIFYRNAATKQKKKHIYWTHIRKFSS